MKPATLTTITAYWKRPDMLRSWVRSLKGSTNSEIHHLIYFVGESPPDWWQAETEGAHITAMVRDESPGMSIGHYHNLGAEQANTEWIMKLDVDALPNVSFFAELLAVLGRAQPREWFNAGMFSVSKVHSGTTLGDSNLPLKPEAYQQIMSHRQTYSSSSYLLPAATNFICRRDDYLELGGCDPRFRGYGWEDYQQIYMLERYQTGKDPLPGNLTVTNVTQRCRDEISRRKARQLWEQNPWLCLMHKWHAGSPDPTYRAFMEPNRKLLFDYISRSRRINL